MKPRKHIKAVIQLTCALALAMPAIVHAQAKKKEIKISHAQQASLGSELHITAWIFRNYVNDNSDTLSVTVHANNGLGEERAVYEAMQLGAGATCALGGTAILNNFSKRVGVIDLPFLWRDYDHMNRVLDGKVGQELAADLEKTGLHAVAWLTNWGVRNVVTSSKPVRTPEDLSGLKIRTIQSQVYVDALNAMGANATPMAFGEVYTAMRTGVLDGFEHGPAVVLTGKYYEVAKYVALTQHLLGPAIFACSIPQWKSLSDKEREVITQGARLAADINRALAPVREQQAFDALREKGMEITDIDTSGFKEKAVAIQDKFAQSRGVQDLLQLIRDAR